MPHVVTKAITYSIACLLKNEPMGHQFVELKAHRTPDFGIITMLSRRVKSFCLATIDGTIKKWEFFKTARLGGEDTLTFFSRRTPAIDGKSAEKSL